MSSSPNHLSEIPSKKRSAPGDDLHTPKRRRTSISVGLVLRTELASATETKGVQTDSSRDRFLPTLTTTEPFYPLNGTSPRSSRLARALGLVQPRILSFHDNNPAPLLAHHLSDPTLPMRVHLSQSLATEHHPHPHTHSAAKHGKNKPDRVLDSGPIGSSILHPCTWSSKELTAVVIRGRVFTYEVEVDVVSNVSDCGFATSVEWTSDTQLAVGFDRGATCLYDVSKKNPQKHLFPQTSESSTPKTSEVNDMSWSKEQGILAVGRMNGGVTYFDPRVGIVKNDPGSEQHCVLGVKWSPDGLLLASGYTGGIVRCMDWRAHKVFDLKLPHGKKAHRGGVKALAWAPWNPRLLATGGGISDHTVRIWSLSGSHTPISGPLHTLPFSSSVSSLHFSPHTTELLSTHGAPCHSSQSHTRRHTLPTTTAATRHALLVHTYPTLQRVHTVADAHLGPIVDSVLSPDGTRVLTFGEDEMLRIWTVWGSRRQEKPVGGMDRYMIR